MGLVRTIFLGAVSLGLFFMEMKQGACAAPETHWAFVPPSRPDVPSVRQARWIRNPIDAFILARLEEERLHPSPEADRTTLIRRLSLDLTGLPPSPQEVDGFLADASTDAYERVVDRLLASPHYGERMAVDWLDAARFADSNGYQVDRDRELYAWRDWVIQAFNSNKPFDQFTVEQIAGDLLPNATLEQRVATGFHRNHMVNEEGGIIPEEFQAEYCADRVETTATVWLAQTFNCARCHDHKFDPFTQRDFYSLYAFFHNVPEKGVGDYSANIRRNNPPFLQLPAPELESRRAQLKTSLAQSTANAAALKIRILDGQSAWEKAAITAPPIWSKAVIQSVRLDSSQISHATSPQSVLLSSLARGTHSLQIEFLRPHAQTNTALRLLISTSDESGKTQQVRLGSLTLHASAKPHPEAASNVVSLSAAETPDSASATVASLGLDPKGKTFATLRLDGHATNTLVYQWGTHSDDPGDRMVLRCALSTDSALSALSIRLEITEASPDLLIPSTLQALLEKPFAQRNKEEQKRLSDFRLSKSLELPVLEAQIATLNRQIDETDLQIPTTLIMQEMAQARETRVLMRGAYDRKGDIVTPQTPATLPPMAEGQPKNRLGLARWLVDPSNPLTARVIVNRYWQSLFGTGLVRTAEDFGTKGEAPSHPALLDWLATEYRRSGWDTKRFMRLLVTSSTYRQSSKIAPEQADRDPMNRLLSRGARFRLQAEFLRDQALAASGLLVRRLGGPSVKPYHPPGLYEQVVAGSSASTYVQGTGDELHRRSLYTYWKRSVPNPAMLLFDAPFRETCAVRRTRTNTPLQALNLMNDPTFVEAARFLGERTMREGGSQAESRLSYAFRLITARRPRPEELRVIRTALNRWRHHFENNAEAAAQLLKVGEKASDSSLPTLELASYTAVASTLLNLDEALTKE